MDITPQDYHPPITPFEPELALTQEAQFGLQSAAKWAQFLSIVGFVACGFIAVIGLFAGSLISVMTSRFSPMGTSSAPGAFFGVFYFFLALFYFLPCLYLYQFSSRAKNGVAYTNKVDVEVAMKKLKSFFKFIGILTIVILGLQFLILLAVFVGLGIGSTMH